MFGFFESRPKQPQAWRSARDMLQAVSKRPADELRNQTIFREIDFEKVIPLIENSDDHWLVYETDIICRNEPECAKLKYVALIGLLGIPKLMVEVMRVPLLEGTLINVIDIRKAYSYQKQMIEAAVKLETGAEKELNIYIRDAIAAMQLLVHYGDIYALPANVHCQVEYYKCSGESIPFQMFDSIERGWFKCAITNDIGKNATVCFQLEERQRHCILKKLNGMPEWTSLSVPTYKKIRTIN